MTRKALDSLLTASEQVMVSAFVDNPVQLEAVHKIFRASMKEKKESLLRGIDMKFLNGTITNAEAGEELRACAEGIRRVEAIFLDLAQFKKEFPKELKANPAR